MRSLVPSLALEVAGLRRSVRVDGMPVDLSAIEFGILAALAREPGAVLTREALLDLVFGPGFADTPGLVDIRVADLRQKLGDDSDDQRLVETVGTLGYRLADIG